MCDLLDWLLVKVTGWYSTSLVLSLKLLFFTWMRVLVLMCIRAKSPQACLTLCDPMDGSPPSSSPRDSPGKNTGVGCHFLLQCMKVKLLSSIQLLATPGTAAQQAPLSMGFSRQEDCSRVPLSSPVSNCLNLCLETQERSRRLKSLPTNKKWRIQRAFGIQESPTASCLVSVCSLCYKKLLHSCWSHLFYTQ